MSSNGFQLPGRFCLITVSCLLPLLNTFLVDLVKLNKYGFVCACLETYMSTLSKFVLYWVIYIMWFV